MHAVCILGTEHVIQRFAHCNEFCVWVILAHFIQSLHIETIIKKLASSIVSSMVNSSNSQKKAHFSQWHPATQILRYSSLTFLPPLQYNGCEWNLFFLRNLHRCHRLFATVLYIVLYIKLDSHLAKSCLLILLIFSLSS